MSDGFRDPVRDRSERRYRLLLELYPQSFRDRFAEDAVHHFLERLDEVRAHRGRLGVAGFWLRTVATMALHGPLERATSLRLRGVSGVTTSARLSWRGWTRNPVPTSLILVSLTLGLGASIAMFSVLRASVLRPLPFPDPDRLVRIHERNPDSDGALTGASPLNLLDWQRSEVGFASVAAWYLTSGTYRAADWVEEVRSAQVTPRFFEVLRTEPALGRAFREEEVADYGPIVLSHGFWTRRFGADPAVVGRTVTSSGRPYRIVGVMPAGFSFPHESVEAWVAWNLDAVYASRPETRAWRFLDAVARLDERTTLESAQARLQTLAQDLERVHPDHNRGWSPVVSPLHEHEVGAARAPLWLAFASVLVVLLIACVNTALLLLSRVPGRARELALRRALGASRSRLVAEVLGENLVLAAVAAALGMACAWLLLRGLVALDPGNIPRLGDVRIDGLVVLFAAVATAVVAGLFGLAPAAAALRGSRSSAVDSSRRTTDGLGDRAWHRSFVGVQMALAMVLLTGATLFSASLSAVLAVDPGFDPDGVATFRVSLDPQDGSPDEIVRYYDELIEHLESLPEVTRAGAAQTLPLSPVGNDFRRPYRPAGAAQPASEAPLAQMRIVTPGYFRTIGMRVLEGGPLPADRGLGDPRVAVVNRTLGQALWPGGDAVGGTFEIEFRDGWQPYSVVGIVEDVRHYGPRSSALPEVYLSHRQSPYLAMSVAARTVGDPEGALARLQEAALEVRPLQPAHALVTLEALVRRSTSRERFLTTLLLILGTIAAVLSAGGVYGVVAGAVERRQREIGVRMALGAGPFTVVREAVQGLLVVAGVGLLVGVAAVLAVGPAVEGLLFSVRVWTPMPLVVVGLLLAGIALAAALVPARRASAVSPSHALRAE